MKIDTKRVAAPGAAGLLAGALVAGVMPTTFAAEAPAKDRGDINLASLVTSASKTTEVTATKAVHAPLTAGSADAPAFEPISVTVELPPEPEVVEPEAAEPATASATASVTASEEAAPAQNAAPEETQDETATAAESFTPAPATSNGVVGIARQYNGAAYVYGASGPSAFDCSGFTSYVYAQVGITLPRSSSAQRSAGVEVSADQAQPGDLVWWPGHVGIYTGNGMHIAARNPAFGVAEGPVYGNPVYIRVG